MIAAIYARKSTDQHVADDAKSVTRQVDNARAFAASQGWDVDDAYIFKDDGISGAETKRLLDRQRMIDLITSGHCPFQVVIMQAQDRFSRRDGHEAFGELTKLAKHVQVWFYSEAKRFTYGTFESNITGILKSEFAAEYRRAIAVKTHEAMRRRAEQGHVTGGRTFGYDNVRVDGHVERRINASEADVVRDIFERYAKGQGFKQIAHALNAQRGPDGGPLVPSPRPQRGRPAGWDPGTVRAVLRRPLYRGVVVYDRTKKRDIEGARHKGRQPKKDPAQVLRVPKPEFRLVPPDIIEAVDGRLAARRSAYLRDAKGRLLGSPRGNGSRPTKHLLAGFIVCACGASFEAVKGSYVCSARRRKGSSVCPSDLTFNVETIDHVFLDALEAVVLAPTFIDRVLDAAFASQVEPDRSVLEQERKRIAGEVTNLTTAIARGGDIPALADALRDRDRQLRAIDAQLKAPHVMPDRDVLRAALELRATDWRNVLRGPHIEQARLVLQHLLDLPIRVHNEPTPKWVAAARPEGLMVGLVQSVASPAGFEPALPA